MNYDREQRLKNRQLFISAIVPAFNEQALIGKFILALTTKLQTFSDHIEIIVIDDGSSDHTSQEAAHYQNTLPIKLIRFSRNFGKELAITAGLEHCHGEVAIIIDCDFQHPLASIDDFIQAWLQGHDMVYGVRQNREHDGRLKRLFTRSFYRLINLMTKTNIPPNAGDFRLLDQKVVHALNQCDEQHRFMKGLYSWVGFDSIGVPYIAEERKAGLSRWHFSKLTELAITGITSFSSVPLRVWGFIGFIVSMISLAYALWIMLATLLFGADVPGFATLAVAIIFFGGIQLLSIGILGEYIGRIFDEVKRRPKYLIAEKTGFEQDETSPS